MREIVLDTETTGLDPKNGDRVVEIGCVELINHVPTGETYHVYLNPERDMPEEAFKVHGLSEEFLSDKPLFKAIGQEFLEFVKDDMMVIHNAPFDMKFLNFELEMAGFKPLPMSQVTDTLVMARQKFPGAQNNLDALCRRFSIDNTKRTLHGALLDSEILAEVYLELIGGREPALLLAKKQKLIQNDSRETSEKKFREPRVFNVSDEEKTAHDAFIDKLNDPVWKLS